MNILFVTWDGPQTNYLSSLFLPIFKGLVEMGFSVSVLQFTWDNQDKIQSNAAICAKSDINYNPVKVLRKPSAALGSLISAWHGKKHIADMVKQYNIDIVMPRSTLPALASMLATKKTEFKLLFDADGLPLDERVDFAGSNPTSIVHRVMRDIEQQAIVRADAVITRSSVASNILRHRAGAGVSVDKYFEVSNGRSKEVFKPLGHDNRNAIRKALNISDSAPIIVYAGSLGPQYCMQQMFSFYNKIKIMLPDTKLLILSSEFSAFKDIAKSDKSVIYKALNPSEIPKYLSASDIGLAIREPRFSMQGVAPIKLGEYLMCGLPVIATEGVGDTKMITDKAGFLLRENSELQLKKAAEWFTHCFKAKPDEDYIATIGVKHFSLENTVEQYAAAIQFIK
ncbi:glycosyltransferase [Vibrio sp. 10N.261.51.F12]|uniref:glycosyltransferase n=1 Tax=Vibrio sp. 10N.261.51.F12 TaxID=3229679 RepID=UPI00354B7F77